jgi:hypothetical protein
MWLVARRVARGTLGWDAAVKRHCEGGAHMCDDVRPSARYGIRYGKWIHTTSLKRTNGIVFSLGRVNGYAMGYAPGARMASRIRAEAGAVVSLRLQSLDPP